MGNKEESYENIHIGMGCTHEGIYMKVLRTCKDELEARGYANEYIKEGFYCAVIQKNKYASWVEHLGKKVIKHETPYYRVAGVKVKDLQVHKIKIDFLKELISAEYLPNLIANRIAGDLVVRRTFATPHHNAFCREEY
jgi:hypothetical protein